jgi:hypothetical protein
LVALVAGCSVADSPYPIAWGPLPATRAEDCRRFQGTYADRGEVAGQTARRSLTRELLGEDAPWQAADRVTLEVTPEGASVTVIGPDKPFVRQFSAKAGEATCNAGQLELRDTRWVASGLMSGRETIRVRLYDAHPVLVARVEERMFGLMFMVVPLSGEAARWFRFARLDAQ